MKMHHIALIGLLVVMPRVIQGAEMANVSGKTVTFAPETPKLCHHTPEHGHSAERVPPMIVAPAYPGDGQLLHPEAARMRAIFHAHNIEESIVHRLYPPRPLRQARFVLNVQPEQHVATSPRKAAASKPNPRRQVSLWYRLCRCCWPTE